MIIGNKIKLRPLRIEDVHCWCRWLNDHEVTQTLFAPAMYGVTRDGEIEWYHNMRRSINDRVFTIETIKGKPIGIIGLHNINWEWRNAELGIIIGDKTQWGKGYGTEAVKIIVEFGFYRMNLHRIRLEVIEINKGAIKCYKRVGFKEEGRKREEQYLKGNYYDTIVMGILRDELVDMSNKEEVKT